MISILILTDNASEWVQKIKCCLNTLRECKTKVGYHLENSMFMVDIENDTRFNRKRRRYSHIIFDKCIQKDYEETVIRPLISNPVIYTTRYLKVLSVDTAKEED